MLHRYNPCFEFTSSFSLPLFSHQRTTYKMTMTSVSGHLLNLSFLPPYNSTNWRSVEPSQLFTAPIQQGLPAVSSSSGFKGGMSNGKIASTLQMEAKEADCLIIWTDCDREGEAIGFEIEKVCKEVNKDILVRRAQFSAATETEIHAAINNLRLLREGDNEAVLARSELDLRLGAVFTRLQTLELGNRYTELKNKVLSFGPCQFPTLGFVARRYEEIEKFEPQSFWYLNLVARGSTFSWDREKLFDYAVPCAIFDKLYSMIQNGSQFVVKDVVKSPSQRYKPLPLNTVALQTAASKYLKIDSKTSMDVAEKLYQQGLISYPRTETNEYPNNGSINLKEIVGALAGTSNGGFNDWDWGNYASKLLSANTFEWPRKGTKNDKAHPPIYPLKLVKSSDLKTATEAKVYEYIVRSFLASVSRNATGSSTKVEVGLHEHDEEGFHLTGTIVEERNFLEVFPYQKWGDKTIPNFEVGEVLGSSEIETFDLKQGQTKSKELLTEAELIKLMDEYEIGTDATIQDHIKTILDRGYAEKKPKRMSEDTSGSWKGKTHDVFHPTNLGFSLIKGYRALNHEENVSMPTLRAKMERDLVLISNRHKSKEEYISENVKVFQKTYEDAKNNMPVFLEVMDNHFSLLQGGSGHEGAARNGGIASTLPLETVEQGFAFCGNCETSTLDLQRQEASTNGRPSKEKYRLNCSECSQVYSLPQSVPHKYYPVADSTEPFNCPICRFEVVEMRKPGSSTGYRVCPNCFNNQKALYTPPAADIEDLTTTATAAAQADATYQTTPCFACTYDDCKLSGVVQNAHLPLGKCQSESCATRASPGDLYLKKSKNGFFYLECNESSRARKDQSSASPECKAVWLPRAKKVSIPVNDRSTAIHASCESCGTRKLNFFFPTEVLGPLGLSPETEFLACPIPQCAGNAHLSEFNQAVRKTRELSSPPASRGYEKKTPNTYSSNRGYGGQRTFGQASTATGETTVNCNCNTAAVELQVTKQSDNTGRMFFTCRTSECGFFKWSDELTNTTSSSSMYGNQWAGAAQQSRRYHSVSGSSSVATTSGDGKKQRMCNVCGTPFGYRKRKCQVCK